MRVYATCRTVRPHLTLVCILALVAFFITLAMVLREFSSYTPDFWQPARLSRPPVRKRATRNETEMDGTKRNVTERAACISEHFKDVLLIIGLGAATEYESIPLFELLYKGAFRNRIYCGIVPLGNDSDATIHVVNTRFGAFLFDCLAQMIRTHPQYAGYLFVGEDVLLNYWNMADLDKRKIWESDRIKHGPVLYEQTSDTWEWWQSPWGVRAMEKVYEYFVELNYYDNRKSKLTDGNWIPDWDAGQALNTWLWNGEGEFICYWSDQSVVYLPRSHADLFVNISKHFRASGVRHAISLPTITRLLTLDHTNEKLNSAVIESKNSDIFLREREKLRNASLHHHFVHISGSRKDRRAILNDLRLKEYAVGAFLQYEHCT